MSTPTQLTFDETIALVREKAKWLTSEDKVKLSEKFGLSPRGVMSQVRGEVKKPSIPLLSAALDMIRVNEKQIQTRL